jgi:hypothetical protein
VHRDYRAPLSRHRSGAEDLMKQLGTLMACAALTTLAFGCDGGEDTDAGIMVDFDAGRDAGTGGTDAGPRDAGPLRECEMSLPGAFPSALTPRCSAATRSCITACGANATCISTCISNDTTPTVTVEGLTLGCSSCVSWQQAYCIEQNGGADLWHALSCCIEDMGCTTSACAQSMCSAQYSAVFSGTNPAAGECLVIPTTGDYALCYATADSDAGMPDAGVDAGPFDAGGGT